MQKPAVIIIGAGIGGLATALALQRAGIRVRVYEQREALGETGAGLSLSPNAVAGLHHLGLADALQKIAATPASFGICHYRTGQVLVDNTVAMTRDNAAAAPYYMIHRADLHALLAEQVRENDRDSIYLQHEFTELTQTDSGVTVCFANGQSTTAELVIGCDGIKSRVRGVLFGAETPRFTGYIAWRGLVPLDRIPGQCIAPESGIYIGEGLSATRYLLAHRKLVNYVAVARRSDWQVESWSVRSDVSEVTHEFRDFHSSLLDILKATPPAHCHKWALFDRDPLPEWSAGRVTLAGDAAHPMLPFMGQGAVMAIEDAVVLTRCLKDTASVPAALQRYVNARRDRCTMVMLESRANIQRLQADPGNYNSASHQNEQRLGLFDYNPATVAI